MATARHRASSRYALLSRRARILRQRIPSGPVVLSAAMAAALLTAGGASAVHGSDSSDTVDLDARTKAASLSGVQLETERTRAVSRSAPRPAAVAPRAVLQPQATGRRFATAPLNVWTGPREEGPRTGLISFRSPVAITGQTVGHWAEILVDGKKGPQVRWVNADYLAEKKPALPQESDPTEDTASSLTSSTSTPAVGGTCSNGSSVVSGVNPSIVEIHQAVCASWPQITSYGTFRADGGDHGSGRAVDIMISGDTGWAVAEFVRANAEQFGISYVIYAQKIWSTDRSGEGWRYMEDRGSVTANHYDHVHVSVY